MKKHIPVLLAMLCSSVLLNACHGRGIRGSGEKTSNKLSVTGFTAIDISVPVKAIITVQPGAETFVEISGYANLLEHVKTKVENNNLHVFMDKDISWNFSSNNETILKVTVPSLSALSADGSVDADIHGVLSGASFGLDISGAGKVIIDSITTSNFSTDVSGAGNITVKGGTVQNATYHISGAGKIKAFPLQASAVKTEISGAAKAEVTALQSLSVDVNGAGSIRYKGHPTLTKDISGAGTVYDAN